MPELITNLHPIDTFSILTDTSKHKKDELRLNCYTLSRFALRVVCWGWVKRNLLHDQGSASSRSSAWKRPAPKSGAQPKRWCVSSGPWKQQASSSSIRTDQMGPALG